MTRKVKINISSTQKLEYAKLMVEEGFEYMTPHQKYNELKKVA